MALRKIRRNKKVAGGDGSSDNVEARGDASEDTRSVLGVEPEPERVPEPKPDGDEFQLRSDEFDPDGDASEPGESGDAEPRKRRKRRSKRDEKEEASDLAELIAFSHVMLAKILDAKELELDESEAKEIANAVTRVQSFYSEHVLPPQAQAWLRLGIVCCMTYGPRFMEYRRRKAGEKPKVVDMPADQYKVS